jgi:hypothetical protein
VTRGFARIIRVIVLIVCAYMASVDLKGGRGDYPYFRLIGGGGPSSATYYITD